MNEQEMFFNYWGEMFVNQLRAGLQDLYPYSPGKDGRAYSSTPPRKGEYRGQSLKGMANKIANSHYGFQQSLYDSISYEYNDGVFQVIMNSYWKYVNDGRNPGKYVPIQPLMVWAMDRLGKSQKEARSMAFGMSVNIQRYGIKPTFFVDDAIGRLAEMMDENAAEALGRSIDDFLGERLEDLFKEINFDPTRAEDQTITLGL